MVEDDMLAFMQIGEDSEPSSPKNLASPDKGSHTFGFNDNLEKEEESGDKKKVQMLSSDKLKNQNEDKEFQEFFEKYYVI